MIRPIYGKYNQSNTKRNNDILKINQSRNVIPYTEP